MNQPSTSTALVNYLSNKNTATDIEKVKLKGKLPLKHNHLDLPLNVVSAESMTENTSQWLIQNWLHINQFEGNLEGNTLLLISPKQTHPQLVVRSRTAVLFLLFYLFVLCLLHLINTLIFNQVFFFVLFQLCHSIVDDWLIIIIFEIWHFIFACFKSGVRN